MMTSLVTFIGSTVTYTNLKPYQGYKRATERRHCRGTGGRDGSQEIRFQIYF